MSSYAPGTVQPNIHPTAYVHPRAVLSGDVEIGPEASVWPGAVIAADGAPVRVGARTSVQDGAVVRASSQEVQIGSDCVIGHLAEMSDCSIGSRSLIGSGSVIPAGAVVGDEALVAAGAVLTEGMVIPSGAMAVGVPASIRPDRIEYEADVAPGVRRYVERTVTYRRHLVREARPGSAAGTAWLETLVGVAPAVDSSARLADEATLIGDVRVGPGAEIGRGAVLRADDSPIEIGENARIGDGVVMHVTPRLGLRVGAGSIIEAGAHLEGCALGVNVVIGAGAIVLPGAEIGDGVTVVAKSVVSGSMAVPAGATIGGVPARPISA